MKPLVFLSLIMLSFISLAQEKKEPSHYVFPDFEPGVVRMKNGNAIRAMLNYNTLSEEMVFLEGGEKRAIVDEQLKDIDTVYIGDRKFFKLDGAFVELLQQSPYQFYAAYKGKMKAPERASAFGTTSQTSSNFSYSPTLSVGAIYDINLPQGTKVTRETSYWLQKDGKQEEAKNLNQLLKLYDNKNAGKDYAKSNKLDFENPKDMLQLVKFLEEDQGN